VKKIKELNWNRKDRDKGRNENDEEKVRPVEKKER